MIMNKKIDKKQSLLLLVFIMILFVVNLARVMQYPFVFQFFILETLAFIIPALVIKDKKLKIIGVIFVAMLIVIRTVPFFIDKI